MDLSGLTDEALVAADGAGNIEALGELVRRHQDRFLRLACRLLGDAERAQDVCQDAFLALHRAASQFQPRARFTTWFYRVVTNLCLDERRRRKRVAAPLPAELADDPPDDPIEKRELARRVGEAVAALPDRQRVALVLHRWEGLSHREIVETTGWSASAVESLLVRAYATLRETLKDLQQD